MTDDEAVHRRVLLKLSGEALAGQASTGIVPAVIDRLAGEIAEVAREGIQIGLVIGGGNLFRGAGLAETGLDRVTGDQMGMLATVMNALAMQAALIAKGIDARVLSALHIAQVGEPYSRARALHHLGQGRVVMFAAGTGNPFFTTDSAASLRAIEIGADVLLKATQVDGIYSADPKQDPDAERFEQITYQEIQRRRLGVMDLTAIEMCREHRMPVRVFDLHEPRNLIAAVRGEPCGTLVTEEDGE